MNLEELISKRKQIEKELLEINKKIESFKDKYSYILTLWHLGKKLIFMDLNLETLKDKINIYISNSYGMIVYTNNSELEECGFEICSLDKFEELNN